MLHCKRSPLFVLCVQYMMDASNNITEQVGLQSQESPTELLKLLQRHEKTKDVALEIDEALKKAGMKSLSFLLGALEEY